MKGRKREQNLFISFDCQVCECLVLLYKREFMVSVSNFSSQVATLKSSIHNANQPPTHTNQFGLSLVSEPPCFNQKCEGRSVNGVFPSVCARVCVCMCVCSLRKGAFLLAFIFNDATG